MSNKRLDELREVDPVLSVIAGGYTNSMMVANYLFPTVKVNKQKGKIPIFGKDAFLLRDTFRAVRADSNRISPSEYSLISYETRERDVEMAIDHIEAEEAAEYGRYEQQVVRDLSDILLLDKERQAAQIALNPDNYESTMKIAVATDEEFDNYDSEKDPLEYILNGKDAVRKYTARMPNTMLIGISAFNALINHPKVLERVKYSGLSKAGTDILSQLVEIDRIVVGRGVYTEDGTDFKDIWTDSIVLAYTDTSSDDVRSEYNPSFGYTLQKRSYPQVDTYYENGGKIKVIRNTDNYDIKITCPSAAYLIYNTNQ